MRAKMLNPKFYLMALCVYSAVGMGEWGFEWTIWENDYTNKVNLK